MIMDDGDVIHAQKDGSLDKEILVRIATLVATDRVALEAGYKELGFSFRIESATFHEDENDPSYSGHPGLRNGHNVTIILGPVPEGAEPGTHVQVPNLTIQTAGPFATNLLLKSFLNGWRLSKAGDLSVPGAIEAAMPGVL